MPSFGQRRGRPVRVSPQKVGHAGQRTVLERLRTRQVLVRLGLCCLGVVAITAAAGGWRPPFPYHVGRRPVRDVRAMIEFDRLNVVATQKARDAAAESVFFVFENNPQPLEELQTTLESELAEVVAVEHHSQLGQQARRDFNLENDEQLKQFREKMVDPESREAVLTGVREALQPVIEKGLLPPGAIPADQPGPRDSILVYRSGEPARRQIIDVSEVRIDSQRQQNSPLVERLKARIGQGEVGERIVRWVTARLVPTLSYDARATAKARADAAAAVRPVRDPYKEGDVLVPRGNAIDEEQMALLREEHSATVAAMSLGERIRRTAAVLLLVALLFGLVGTHIVQNEPRLVRSIGHLSVLLGLVVAAVFLAVVLSGDPWRAEIIPLLLAVMMLAIAYDHRLALLIAFAVSLLVTQATGGELQRFVVLMGVTATSVLLLGRIRSRTVLIKVGFAAGLVYFLLTCCTGILTYQGWEFFVLDGLRGLAWGLTAGFLISGSLPFVEGMFGVLTDISLLELGDISHPLLHELVRRAPGTYNHSVAVASIGEAAAEAIGANGLLVRVGAYFHDIGKMLKPHYFVENQTDGNRHENLAPAMSTLIIIGHVKDGVDLARQYNLPQRIVDFIEQHHGTTLVEYFYNEASRQHVERPDVHDHVEESAFRYPGPKPQSKEDGVLMLADSVESASRTLSEPTPARIESLVHDLAMKRLLGGQFDESGLNLKEIRTIEESLIKSLIAVYHGRIKYPEPRTA